MENETGKGKSLANYVFLGAFLGGLVGTTIVLFTLAESSDEKKEQIRELRQELLSPVSARITEIINNIGDSFRKALNDISHE